MPAAKYPDLAFDRVFVIGEGAHMRRMQVDFDYPPMGLFQKHVQLCQTEREMWRLQGYDRSRSRLVLLGPSTYQRNYLRGYGVAEISLDEAVQWFKLVLARHA